jgi:crossover junction endodeoxyribonuclease RuvC
MIYDGVSSLLARHTPDALAVESAFYGRNVRTAVVLSHARGVILLAGELAGVAVAEYSPALIKKAIVGRGAALKPQVGYMVAQLLRLKSPPAPADAADGVAVALTHVMVATRRAAFARQVAGHG